MLLQTQAPRTVQDNYDQTIEVLLDVGRRIRCDQDVREHQVATWELWVVNNSTIAVLSTARIDDGKVSPVDYFEVFCILDDSNDMAPMIEKIQNLAN